MATKEEYIAVLGQMEELYYNNDNCTLPMNLFKEDINLLTRLVNEHFEEKTETNYEYFKDEIIENCGFTFALVGGKPHKCACVNCNDCGFSTGHGCTEKIKEWLKKPHEKPVSVYKLTKFEKELLECYSAVYSFKELNTLMAIKKYGLFRNVPDNVSINEILRNCEVI